MSALLIGRFEDLREDGEGTSGWKNDWMEGACGAIAMASRLDEEADIRYETRRGKQSV